VKMLISDLWHVPTVLSLAVIALCLTVAITLSWRREQRDEAEAEAARAA
jgi:hypothetical protein